jgi:sensor histidine kinase YesM
VLQPLVENAIRHAVARRSGPTRVRVRVGCEGDDLLLEVHDDGPGCAGEPGHPRTGTGIGLANTRQRLQRIYGDRAHEFVFEGAAPPLGGARVRIRLPLQRRPPALPVTDAAAEATPDLAQRPTERPWLSAWLLFAAAMLVLNLAWSSARYLVQARETGLSWSGTFATGAPGAIALVLLFPLVHAANRHVVARIPRLAGRLAVHALLVVALSVAKSTFVSASAAVVFGLAAAPSVLALVMTRIYADVLHYALMVGLCHALERQREHRVQALRAARLEAELAGAQLEALRLRLQPGTLFAALDRLEALIDGAPEEADRLVASLGDRLRQLLRDSAVAEARAP